MRIRGAEELHRRAPAVETARDGVVGGGNGAGARRRWDGY